LIVRSTPLLKWLTVNANIFIEVELPSTGTWTPRLLECSATVAGVRRLRGTVRVTAAIGRMIVVTRDCPKSILTGPATTAPEAEPITAVEGPRNLSPVILRDHLTNVIQRSLGPDNSSLNTKQVNTTQGENNMSFLKNLFIEEDGQDMVEYGLVIALVVLAAAAIMTGFKTSIGTAFTALGTDVTTQIK
jgi:pilus assembly protein Flp/PilA